MCLLWKKGSSTYRHMWENMRKYGVPVVVAINRFHTERLAVIDRCCEEMGVVPYALSEVFAKGGDGGMDLARR